MQAINQWAAMVIIDHGDDERGEFKTVGIADTADAAMEMAHSAAALGGYVGYTAKPI